MKKTLNYIYIILFVGFIWVSLIINIVSEDKSVSEIENKVLRKMPRYSLSRLMSGEFTSQYEQYVTDQFYLRTNWVELRNKVEKSLGKFEVNDVILGKDGYIFENYRNNFYQIDLNIYDVNKLVKDLDGIDIEFILVPNSVYIHDDLLPDNAYVDNQLDMYKYINDKIDVPIYSPIDVLKSKRDEYIYFRLDHHWTQLGAYYTYLDYYNKDELIKYDVVSNEFYGTYFSKFVDRNLVPDDIYSFEVDSEVNVCINIELCSDKLYYEDHLQVKNKYDYYMNGNFALITINNEDVNKGEIAIIKDSYANALIPFLTNEYSYIHIIDPRFFKGSISDYLNDNNIDNLLFIYNLSHFNSRGLELK